MREAPAALIGPSRTVHVAEGIRAKYIQEAPAYLHYLKHTLQPQLIVAGGSPGTVAEFVARINLAHKRVLEISDPRWWVSRRQWKVSEIIAGVASELVDLAGISQSLEVKEDASKATSSGSQHKHKGSPIA